MTESIIVGIEKNWDDFWITDQEFLSQARDGAGRWGKYAFKIGYSKDCDYLIVLNRPKSIISTRLPTDRIWGVIQEPPNEIFWPMHKGQSAMGRVYNQVYEGFARNRTYYLSPPLIPWFLRKSWHELSDLSPPQKERLLCCVTSRNLFYNGHKRRARFTSKIETDQRIDFHGRGYKEFKDKWDVLRPYKFSLVIENFISDFYWTEKLCDCILSWTIPIYFGSRMVEKIFPEGAVIPLDIEAENAEERLFSICNETRWEDRLHALDQARNLILNDYSFFARMSGELDRGNAEKKTEDGATKVLPVAPSILAAWTRSFRRKLVLKVVGAGP